MYLLSLITLTNRSPYASYHRNFVPDTLKPAG
jgi:hypothetical protein